MDPKELRGLLEAYQDVYQVDEATAMAKRGLDEPAIRNQIAKSTGGGASADRATALANTKTYGASGTDPKAREKLARTQRGDFRNTSSSNPGLKGYAHQSTDPDVIAIQAARGAQRGVLTPNEKKTLNREGFEQVGEEIAPGVKPYEPGPTGAEVRADAKKAAAKKAAAGKDKEGYGPEEKFKSDWKLKAVPSSVSKRKTGEEETVSQRMDRERPYAKRPIGPLFTKQGSRTASAVTRATEGPGEPQAVTMPRMKSKLSTEIVRRTNKESYDLYDLILSHLLDEGYASSVESAEAIMVNMSEDWRNSIIED